MERWSGRVAIVTGAGSGIGEAVAIALVKHGLKVVGVDNKNHNRVEEAANLLQSGSEKLYAVKADVSKEEEVLEVFNWVKKNLARLDVMVNCAGVFKQTKLSDFESDDFHKIFDVNVIGLSIFTREAIKYMKETGIDDGHIVNVCSITGHFPPHVSSSVYSSTKHAVRVLSEGLRRELMQRKSNIRVTNVSPGAVNTDLYRVLNKPVERPTLQPEDIADSIVFALAAPSHVQIHELTILPVGEIFP